MTRRTSASPEPSLIAVAAITEIQPAPRPPNWIRIRSGRRIVAILHPREASPLVVRIGQTLDDHLLRSLQAATARSRVRRDAERLLARRALTRQELQLRLLAKEHEPEPVTAVLDTLEQAGALNDEQLAAAAAQRSLSSGRRAGREVIRTLEVRGVRAKLARRAVAAAVQDSGESDFDRALHLATSRLRAELTRKDALTQRRRLSGVLSRRGYDEDTIERVLDRLVPAPRSGDRD